MINGHDPTSHPSFSSLSLSLSMAHLCPVANLSSPWPRLKTLSSCLFTVHRQEVTMIYVSRCVYVCVCVFCIVYMLWSFGINSCVREELLLSCSFFTKCQRDTDLSAETWSELVLSSSLNTCELLGEVTSWVVTSKSQIVVLNLLGEPLWSRTWSHCRLDWVTTHESTNQHSLISNSITDFCSCSTN